MKKMSKLSLSIILTLLLGCGGVTEQKTTENQTDSTEKKTEEKVNETTNTTEETENKNTASTDQDGVLNRSLVGKWSYESGETGGELDGSSFDFMMEGKFASIAGMFSTEGTYTVKDGKLIIQAKVTNGEEKLGREFTQTFTIVKITNELPYKLLLKNSKGTVLTYNFTESYGD